MRAGLYPPVQPKRIDYARMNKEHPRLKGMLTRAENSGDPLKVAKAVDAAVTVWNEVGAWPDEWARWRNALEEAWDRFCAEEPPLNLTYEQEERWFKKREETAKYMRQVALPFAF